MVIHRTIILEQAFLFCQVCLLNMMHLTTDIQVAQWNICVGDIHWHQELMF